MDLSIIIPVYNEEKFIINCLESITKQDFLGLNVEILIADGGSSDSTKTLIEDFEDPRIILLDNKMKFQVYALNLMIKQAKGEYIIRCDAHAEYEENYFISLINQLKENDNLGNVGSKVVTVPQSGSGQSELISIALGSKFGVGSSHRTNESNQPIEVDTVLFGAWRKEIFDKVGLFDEEFIRGQDLEHNIRIKKAGFEIIQINGPKVTYYARDSKVKLFNMMKQYASVKPYILKKHRIFPTFRALVPFSFYLFLLISCLISLKLFLVVVLIYVAFLAFGAFLELRKRCSLRVVAILELASIFALQHAGHAYGMLYGFATAFRGKINNWSGTR